MKKRWLILPIFISILIFTLLPVSYISANPSNLITNGDFSTGDFTGWTIDFGGSGGNGATNFYAEIASNNGYIAEYQDISITSPNLAFSFDVRSDPNTMDNNYFVELIYYSGGSGGTEIERIEWSSNSSIPNWITISEPNVMDSILASNPSVNFSTADTVRVRFGVEYNSAQFALSNFDNFTLINNISPQTEAPAWIRNMPMTCYQVWINEDNMFEMVFWYPYKDNNFVRIYDMEGNMVYEVDMPLENPHIVVDLPDGCYWVRTFNDDPNTPLQEFLIGKPGPEM